MTTARHNKKPRGATRFPGIGEDAQTLGVNRATLYRMLDGQKPWANLKSLRRRYNDLQAKKAKHSQSDK